MIKKAVLPLLAASFLMVCSDYSHAITSANEGCYIDFDTFEADKPPGWRMLYRRGTSPEVKCNDTAWLNSRYNYVASLGIPFFMTSRRNAVIGGLYCSFYGKLDDPLNSSDYSSSAGSCGFFYNTEFSDEQCSTSDGSSLSGIPPETYNYLINGGSIRTNAGACSVYSSGGVSGCNPVDGLCSLNIESISSGDLTSAEFTIQGGLATDTPSDFDTDFSPPDYLFPLGGVQCNDPSSCVSIGDSTYLVDWDTAPSYFSYVGSDGNTYPPGSDSFGFGVDNGGDSGGSDSGDDSGGSSGGRRGSTVPEFEFDESGIIEAIRSSGQSNRNAINALSNDVTREISDQTNDLNASTSAQTEALTNTINSQTSELVTQGDRQTGKVTTAITSQTQSVQNTLDNQTRSLNSTLKGLEKSLVDAFKNITVRFSGRGAGSSSGTDGDGDGESVGEGEGDGIDGLFNSLVDKLASRFTEELGDGDLFDSSGLDETLDGVTAQEQAHSDEINTLMDDIGDGASSDIAEQITSRLPSLPSGGCVPLQFGPMEISCRPFNIIKSWLTWAIYFYSVISIINTFFRSEQRMA